MGRAPCCDKNGLKKGPWTVEEDQKLIDYVQKHGHGSWRTLPKNAGIYIFLSYIFWVNFACPRLDLLDLSSILSSSLFNSSQLNVSRLLGIQPLVDPELLRLATTLLSSQRENPDFHLQNLQENQLCNSQVQNQFPSFQPNHLETHIEEIPCCTTSTAPCAPFETQLLETNVEQFPSDHTNFSFQNSQPTVWQDNGVMPCNLMENFIPFPNYGCYNSDQPIIDDPLSQNSTFQADNNSNQNFSLASALSTPSTSPTRLNSSSTYINSSIEDERDSYRSYMLEFEIRNMLDINDFM
ncbi:hypothetical protein HHK36_002002 [Tetracentron sinense]|uniref:Uncharacterized protein n=1 Tax=Tetracentron sinense TaxID=13715 RepID=A0A835DVA3_TETSI|nr:hypothetical protein HHK36_002002 [Tetracentron sinense]